MDTITQAALGAAIGEAGWRRTLGGRGVIFGMICGLLPDLDVIAAAVGPWESLVFHRSWTHSLLVLPLAAPVVGAIGKRAFRSDAPLGRWAHLAFWALITHPLLDVCTTYGTQLLAPLSDRRFSLDAVSIIDPIYTVPLLIALALARIRAIPSGVQRGLNRAALLWGVAYLGVGWGWSQRAEAAGRAALASEGVALEGVRTPPMMMIGPNRKVVARADRQIYIGVMSALVDDQISMRRLPSEPGDPAVAAALETREGRIWSWFADGYLQHQIERHADGTATLRMVDQKYGVYSTPEQSVFVAVAEVGPGGEVRSVTQTRETSGLDPARELRLGWALALGGAAALEAARAE